MFLFDTAFSRCYRFPQTVSWQTNVCSREPLLMNIRVAWTLVQSHWLIRPNRHVPYDKWSAWAEISHFRVWSERFMRIAPRPNRLGFLTWISACQNLACYDYVISFPPGITVSILRDWFDRSRIEDAPLASVAYDQTLAKAVNTLIGPWPKDHCDTSWRPISQATWSGLTCISDVYVRINLYWACMPVGETGM